MMNYFLGIDLGTTRTSAAVGHPGRPGEVVVLGDRSSAIPSVLHAGADGTVLVGDAAERRAISDPARVVREFKRRIGDPTPIVVGGVAWSPQELSARVVRWVVDRVREREGGPAARVAVTHPASWGPLKRDLLGSALAGQGVPVSFLAEPQAAALHYASTERLGPGSTVAVYDLGGGTFDAAVVHKTGASFSLVGRPEGLERLGGVDFDQAVFDHVRAAMPDAFAALDDTDPAVLSAVASVRRECSEAKEALSADTEVTIPVLLPGAQGSVRLHRTEFESMIRPQIEETVAALRRAVASAGMTPEQLTAVLLVGGSSRIPLVAQLVSEQLGRPVAVDADPKNAIALGAALSLDPGAASGGTGAFVPQPRGAGPGGPGFAGVRGSGVGPAVGAGVVGGMAAAGARGLGSGTGSATALAGGFTGPTSPVVAGGPPTAALGGAPVLPPPRPAAVSERPARPEREDRYWSDEDYDDDYERPRGGAKRSPALLVSAGGLAAALAVVALLFFMPQDPVTTPAAGDVSTPSTPSIGAPVDTGSLTPTPTETDETPVEEPTSARPAPPRPTSREPVVPPTQPPRTTVAPTTTAAPTTTTPPPTTEPPPTTTTPPAATTEPAPPPAGP
jgi:actin-like ATPase involved in cell morphogenesis